MKNRVLQNIFIGTSLIYLILIFLKKEDFAIYLKPLLIPILFFSVVKFEDFKTKKWLLISLLFSWIGDVILLFANKGELYFIFGLISFLVAHILFIVLFTKQESDLIHKESKFYWFGFGIVLLYLFGMLSLLLPKLGNLKFPVGIYAMTISLMLIETIKGYFNWNRKGKNLILFGAIFFVISDSFLAINKFYASFPGATFVIMITYLTAQLLISKGILDLNKK